MQVAVYNSTEWWWFQGSFYKVEFAEGSPSADLIAALESSDMKISLSIVSVAEQGYSPDEVAEGVLELEGKAETAVEYAHRMDAAHDIIVQVEQVLKQDRLVSENDTPRDYGLQKDTSAKVFTKKTTASTQLVIESDVHGSAHVLTEDSAQAELYSQLQHYHPILVDKRVDKRVGKGRYWKFEVIAEWWWFDNDIYIAKREKGYLSKALAALKSNIDSMRVNSKAESWIPKYKLGNEPNGNYEEGYAPDEIVRLVYASQTREESLEEMFERIQSAKSVISKNPGVQEPWDESYAAFNRNDLREYLQERRSSVGQETGGSWKEFRQWQREQTKALLAGLDDNDDYKPPAREPIPKRVKTYVWQRDQGRCVNCGSNEKLEYDHIIPLSKGGSNTERNIQLLCERCNRSKGATIS